MKADLDFDMTGFRSVLRRYLDTTSKSMAKALNSKAYDIAWHAEKFTKRASRASIEELGVIGHRLRRNRKTGILGKGAAIHKKNSRARSIVVGRYRKEGKEIVSKEVEKKRENS